jgi:hypothetical protein
MSILSLLGTAASLIHVALAASADHIGLEARDGSSPSLTHDPNTTTFCTWWVDLQSARTCSSVLSENAITLEQFRRWVSLLPDDRSPDFFH